MADDIVSIVVEIVDSFSEELEELRAQLESLDLEDIDVDVHIKERGFEQVMAKKEMLDDDIVSTVHFRSRGSSLSGDGPPTEAITETVKRQIRDMGDVPLWPGAMEGFGADRRIGIPGTDELVSTSDFPDLEKTRSQVTGSYLKNVRAIRSVSEGARPGAAAIRRLDLRKRAAESRKALGRLGQKLRDLAPNMMQVWNVLAASIPILVTMAGAAIGLAGALGAVATAGAAILGVGLLGFGQSLSESMEMARQKVQLLKQELFEAVQPAAMQFRPIVEDFFRALPRQAARISSALEGMTVFTDELAAAGTGLIDWFIAVIEQMASMDEMVGVILADFGQAFGNFIINWMSNMVEFAAKNRQMITRLASAIVDLFEVLFDVSVVISRVFSTMKPLTGILATLSGLLNNKLVSSLLTLVGVLVAIEAATLAWAKANALLILGQQTARATFLANAKALATRYIPTVKAAIAQTYSLLGATTALRKALLTTGLGIAAVGAGLAINELFFSSDIPNQRGGGGAPREVTNINVQGDVGRREMDRVLDKVGTETRSEVSLMEEQEING